MTKSDKGWFGLPDGVTVESENPCNHTVGIYVYYAEMEAKTHIEVVKAREYVLSEHMKFVMASSIVFDHCPDCGEKIDWQELEDLIGNITKCEECGALTTHEKRFSDQPSEGEKCIGECDRWLCDHCIDWNRTGDNGPICKNCSEEN